MDFIEINEVSYFESKKFIHRVRNKVFIVEQKVPVELEFDEKDPVSSHVVAFIKQASIATGRIASDGKIGRMAVLKEFRRKGVGTKILEKLIQIGAENRIKKFYISSQCHAIPFYEKKGFFAEGPIYKEAGIDHRLMKKSIKYSQRIEIATHE